MLETRERPTTKAKLLPAFMRFPIKLIQTLLYIPIQIAFIPLAIIGMAVTIPIEMGRTRADAISFSAVKALQYRWIAHYLRLRPDAGSIAFTKKFPYESHIGMWLVLGPQIIAKHLFGFSTRAVQIVSPEETSESTAITRVLIFDSIVEKHGDSVEQIVLPGAGFDLINLSHVDKEKHTIFELNQVNTQRAKVDTHSSPVNHRKRRRVLCV